MFAILKERRELDASGDNAICFVHINRRCNLLQLHADAAADGKREDLLANKLPPLLK